MKTRVIPEETAPSHLERFALDRSNFQPIHLGAGHSQLFQNRIFGTPEGKSDRRGRKHIKFGKMIRSDGIQTNSKSKTSCADSNLRARCEARGTSKDLTRLRPRDEVRKSEIQEE
ncbi:hypothetical protein AVEN_135568-1 [Araneus ventricosus]|uniref:Uncharacterized protein n=1 Tax=Araneus ventricosus TaxID=182803 RepID=A0A4Y2W4L7_ARAVE|nr:hypothetical protein AVEN_135568-1 [Araneus ventricosus]